MNAKQNYIFIIVCALIGVLMVTCLVACSNAQNTQSVNQSPIPADGVLGFETVHAIYEKATVGVNEYDINAESGVWVYYLREKLTDVMYVWRTTARESNVGGYSYWSSGMTVLMDPATGGPMTYDAWLQYAEGAKGGA